VPYTDTQLRKIAQTAYDTERDKLPNRASVCRFHELPPAEQSRQAADVRNTLNIAAALYPPEMTAEEYIEKSYKICEERETCAECPLLIPQDNNNYIKRCCVDPRENPFTPEKIIAAVQSAKFEKL